MANPANILSALEETAAGCPLGTTHPGVLRACCS
jgi:hypothetical protein